MLQTLSKLGQIQEKEEETKFKSVIGIYFDNGKYRSPPELLSYINNSKYLYQRDFSGKPGLFLSGGVPYEDIKKLNDLDNEKFIKNKILWFPRGKLVNNDKKLSGLSEKRRTELKGILEEFKNNGTQISKEVIQILRSRKPERTLLTILINNQYIGDIEDYAEFFNKGVVNKKENTTEEELICNVCNRTRSIYSYAESPIPFFYSTKLHFFEGIDPKNITRGFPVCLDCYRLLNNGIKFVRNRLDYRISTINIPGKKKINDLKLTDSGIRFWLIPSMNNYELLERFKERLGENKQLYFLESLKSMCRGLYLLQTADVQSEEEEDYATALLRFSALFYTTDKQGLMRVHSVVHDIYPPRLEQMVKVKQSIDNTYPFQSINNEQYLVGLPLLVTFFKDIKPQWENQIIQILNKLFTSQQVPIEQIIQNINLRVHEILRYTKDLKIISKIALDGLMLLEYITGLNGYFTGPNVEDKAQHITMLRKPTYETIHTDKFIEAHKSVLDSETKRGIFDAGITVAIFLYVQEQRFKKIAPYWDKLNRLNLNPQKVLSFYHDVKRRMAIYRNWDHDTILSYTSMAHVIDPKEPISSDLCSYIFTLGLSFGYMLARRNLKDSEGEEVNTKE